MDWNKAKELHEAMKELNKINEILHNSENSLKITFENKNNDEEKFIIKYKEGKDNTYFTKITDAIMDKLSPDATKQRQIIEDL